MSDLPTRHADADASPVDPYDDPKKTAAMCDAIDDAGPMTATAPPRISTRPRCARCQQFITIDTDADEDLWAEVIGERFGPGYICAGCFTRAADERLIDWIDRLRFVPLSLARHRLAATSLHDMQITPALFHPCKSGEGVGECPASPDHADIKETIEDAADDWQAKGYTSALAEVRDMAAVGRSLMEALPKGYCYMDSPAEIVSDLQNDLDEARGIFPNLTALTPDATQTREAELVAALRAWEPEGDDRVRPLLLAEADRRDALEYNVTDANHVITFLLHRLDRARAQGHTMPFAQTQEMEGEWLPISDDAKSGAMVELVVDYSDGDHPLADGVLACTIGFNTLADTGEDEWKFAGWCWTHDHFVQGKGTPVAWRPSRLNATDDGLPALPARAALNVRGGA